MTAIENELPSVVAILAQDHSDTALHKQRLVQRKKLVGDTRPGHSNFADNRI